MNATETADRARRLLLDQRDALLADIRRHLHASGEPEQLALLNHLESTGDWVEADVFAENDLALLAHELAHLRAIDEALARLDAHAYGTCLECATPIPEERLRAQPTAQFCVACQQDIEARRARLHIR